MDKMRTTMDKTDKAMLSHLQRDATVSVGNLAEKVGISKSACWRRMQKLVDDDVILERITRLNQEKVNLPLTVFISVRTNQHNDAWAKKFQEVAELVPGVLEAYRMSGDLDYLIKAVTEDMSGYDRLYKQLIKADLFDVSASFVMETLKNTMELPLDRMLD